MTTTDPNAPPDELGDPNALPDPIEGALVPSETSLASAGFVDVDEYHQEVANRSHVRQTLFLKWDTGNGLFKVGEDIISGIPGAEELLCTVNLAMFAFQYWKPNQGGLGCENPNPGKFPSGNWIVSETETKPRLCATCDKNPRNGAKGDACKDALNIAMSICMGGSEKLAKFSSSNFKVVGDFNMFLDKLKGIGVRLFNSTLKIGKGDAIDVKGKKMYGWKLQVVARDKPLSVYLREQAGQKAASAGR